MFNHAEWLWSEKFRPRTLDECVLSHEIRATLQSFVTTKNIPNIILCGPYGVGKTTAAFAVINDIGAEFIKINASKARGIDTIRDEMHQFAIAMSFTGLRKYIILDEADGLTNDSQNALKGFIEEHSSNCGFIFTCNELGKIIPAIQSRCEIIEFNLTKAEFNNLGSAFFYSLKKILKDEKVDYDPKVVVSLIKKFYPDFRKIITKIHSYSLKNKKIDTGILAYKDENYGAMILPFLRDKAWSEMRTFVGENGLGQISFTLVARSLIRELEPLVERKSLALVIDMTNEYDYKNYFVVDKEINLIAYLTEVMNSVVFK